MQRRLAPAPAAPALAPSRGFGPAPEGVHPAVLRPSTGGNPLPAPIQAKMEGALGHDFSNVRVHQGDEAPSIGALAFARGSHLHFAPGQYRPHSADGQRILAHELAHVVQQRAGEVRSPGGAVPVNDHPALEAEADAAAARVVDGGAAPALARGGAPVGPRAGGAGPIQLGKKKTARRKAQKAAHTALIEREKTDTVQRRERHWRRHVEPLLANAGATASGVTRENLMAEGPTARSLFVHGTDLKLWDLMEKDQRQAIRARHKGVRAGTPDLVLHPHTGREQIADIFTARGSDVPHVRERLAQAAAEGKFDDKDTRRDLFGVYDRIRSGADEKMRKYGGGTTAVANLTRVPWVDPETIRRVLVKHYGGADNVPGKLIGTINDDESPVRSRVIPIWPAAKPDRDGQGHAIEPEALHYDAYKKAEDENPENGRGGLDLEGDDAADAGFAGSLYESGDESKYESGDEKEGR